MEETSMVWGSNIREMFRQDEFKLSPLLVTHVWNKLLLWRPNIKHPKLVSSSFGTPWAISIYPCYLLFSESQRTIMCTKGSHSTHKGSEIIHNIDDDDDDDDCMYNFITFSFSLLHHHQHCCDCVPIFIRSAVVEVGKVTQVWNSSDSCCHY